MNDNSGSRFRTRSPESQAPPRWLGFLHLAVGLGVCLLAAGVFPLDEGKLHAPRWVLFLCGVVFVLGGTIVLTHGNLWTRSVLAALAITSLGTIALWISFNGDASRFGGNVPLASPEQRVSMARVAFGFGGAACYLIVAIAAARTLLRRS